MNPQQAVENLKEAWRLLNKVYPDVEGIFNQRDYDELKKVQDILLFKCQLINRSTGNTGNRKPKD